MQNIVKAFTVAAIASCALAAQQEEPVLSINTDEHSVVVHDTDIGSWKISLPEPEDLKGKIYEAGFENVWDKFS